MENVVSKSPVSVTGKDTDKKKKLSEMSNDEKRDFYDAEIRRLQDKMEKVKEKRNRVGSLSEKSWVHVCCSFAGTFFDRAFVADTWYQGMNAKDRETAIRDYAKKVKEAAEKGGFTFPE